MQLHAANFALCPPIFPANIYARAGCRGAALENFLASHTWLQPQRCICQPQSKHLLPCCYPLSRRPPCPFSIPLTITSPRYDLREPTAGVEPAWAEDPATPFGGIGLSLSPHRQVPMILRWYCTTHAGFPRCLDFFTSQCLFLRSPALYQVYALSRATATVLLQPRCRIPAVRMV